MSSSTGTTDKSPRCGHERKRQVHNEVERRRKDKINNWIFKIGDLLPSNDTHKQSKNWILEQAVEYIKHLKESKEKLLLETCSEVQAEEIRSLKKQIHWLKEKNASYGKLLKSAGISPALLSEKVWHSKLGKYSNKITTEQASALLSDYNHKASVNYSSSKDNGTEVDEEQDEFHNTESSCSTHSSSNETRLSQVLKETTAGNDSCSAGEIHEIYDCTDDSDSNKESSGSVLVSVSQNNENSVCNQTTNSSTFSPVQASQINCSLSFTTSNSQGFNSQPLAFASKSNLALGAGGVTQALPQNPVMSTCQNFSIVQNYNQKSQSLPSTQQSQVPESTTSTVPVTLAGTSVIFTSQSSTCTPEVIAVSNSEIHSNCQTHSSSSSSCLQKPNPASSSLISVYTGTSTQSNTMPHASPASSFCVNGQKIQMITQIPILGSTVPIVEERRVIPNSSLLNCQLLPQQSIPNVASKDTLAIPADMQLPSQVADNVFVIRFISQPSGVASGHLVPIQNTPCNYSFLNTVQNTAVCQPVVNNGVIVEKPLLINVGCGTLVAPVENIQPQQAQPSAFLLPNGQIIPIVTKAPVITIDQPGLTTSSSSVVSSELGINKIIHTQGINTTSALCNYTSAAVNSLCTSSSSSTNTITTTAASTTTINTNAVINGQSNATLLHVDNTLLSSNRVINKHLSILPSDTSRNLQEKQSSVSLQSKNQFSAAPSGLSNIKPKSINNQQQLNMAATTMKNQANFTPQKRVSTSKKAKPGPPNTVNQKASKQAAHKVSKTKSQSVTKNLSSGSKKKDQPVAENLITQNEVSMNVLTNSDENNTCGSIPLADSAIYTLAAPMQTTTSSAISVSLPESTFTSNALSNDILAKATQSIFCNAAPDLSPPMPMNMHDENPLCESNVRVSTDAINSLDATNSTSNVNEHSVNNEISLQNFQSSPTINETSTCNVEKAKTNSESTEQLLGGKDLNEMPQANFCSLSKSVGNNCESVSHIKTSEVTNRNRKQNLDTGLEPYPKKAKVGTLVEEIISTNSDNSSPQKSNLMQVNNSDQNHTCTPGANSSPSVSAADASLMTSQTSVEPFQANTESPLPTMCCLQNSSSLNEQVSTGSTSVQRKDQIISNTTGKEPLNDNQVSANIPSFHKGTSHAINIVYNSRANISNQEIPHLFLSTITDGNSNFTSAQSNSNCDISFLTLSPGDNFDSNISSKDATESTFNAASILDSSTVTKESACISRLDKFKQFNVEQSPAVSEKDAASPKISSHSALNISSLSNAIFQSNVPNYTASRLLNLPTLPTPVVSNFTPDLSKGCSLPDDTRFHQNQCREKTTGVYTSVPELQSTLPHLNQTASSSPHLSSNLKMTDQSSTLPDNICNLVTTNITPDLPFQIRAIPPPTFVSTKTPAPTLQIPSVSYENQQYYSCSSSQHQTKELDKRSFNEKSSSHTVSTSRQNSVPVLPRACVNQLLSNSESFGESNTPRLQTSSTTTNNNTQALTNKQTDGDHQISVVPPPATCSGTTSATTLNRPSVYSAESLIQGTNNAKSRSREDFITNVQNSRNNKDPRKFTNDYLLHGTSTLQSNDKNADNTAQNVSFLMAPPPPSLGTSGFSSSYVSANHSAHSTNTTFGIHPGVQPTSNTPNHLTCLSDSSSPLSAKSSISQTSVYQHPYNHFSHASMDDQNKLPKTYSNISFSLGEGISHNVNAHQNKTVSQNVQPLRMPDTNPCFQHLSQGNNVNSRIDVPNSHFIQDKSASISVPDANFALLPNVPDFQHDAMRGQKNFSSRSITIGNFPETPQNFIGSVAHGQFSYSSERNFVTGHNESTMQRPQEVQQGNTNPSMKHNLHQQNSQSHNASSNHNRVGPSKMGKSKKDKQPVSEEIVTPTTAYNGTKTSSYLPVHDVSSGKSDTFVSPIHSFSVPQRPFLSPNTTGATNTNIHKPTNRNTNNVISPTADIVTNPQQDLSFCSRTDNSLTTGYQTPSFNVNSLHRPATTTTQCSLPCQITTHSNSTAPRPVPNFNLSNIFPDINTSTDIISLPPMKFHPPPPPPPPHIFPPTPPQLRTQPPSLQSNSSHHSAHQNCGLYPGQHHSPVIHNSFNSIIGHAPHSFDSRNPIQMTGSVTQTVGPPHPTPFGPTHTPSFGNVIHSLNFTMQDR